ncbi:FAD-binding domain-containing protein [Setomelanomma holmii]|uniref:Delta(24)-sterol reductase n=1 Tax=Setomelanomma holmii TaxID=210430 RepID=A0A9P4LNZ8_9PLEO|nr:FAD-binding domain-containing protein [Setomelanomma holmii]
MLKEHAATAAHAERVKKISHAVKSFSEQGIAFRIYHGSSNSTRAASRQEVVDISKLKNVISIDTTNKTAVVEPGIAMDDLMRYLRPYNLIPAVVPDFPGITAGGAFAGTAAESSSFRYGYFDRTVVSVEIVLGNGEIVQASPAHNADLFFGSVGALGTLGITTQLEVQLIDCGRYVEVNYIPVHSHSQALQMFEQAEDNVDFIDAIMFSNRHGVVVEGRLVEKLGAQPVTRFTRAKDPWFFTHVHKKIRCGPATDTFHCLTCHWTQHSRTYRQDSTIMSELVPVEDFVIRYDRGVFWMAAYGWAPNLWNRFTRFFLNFMFHTRFQYRVVHLVGGMPHIVQDFAIPEHKADVFLHYLHNDFNIYSLWLCPIKHDARAPMHTAQTCTEHTRYLVNIGVWGSPNYGSDYLHGDNYDQFVENNRKLEDKVANVRGLKWLYACNYYQETEFWRNYDKERYDELRTQWKADRLPNIWQKIRRSQQDLRLVAFGQWLMALLILPD